MQNTNPTLKTRKATIDDSAVIRRILRLTWLDTYGEYIPKDDILGYLEKTYSDDAQKAMFENKEVDTYLMQLNEEDIGYMRLTYNLEQHRLYISSLYILPGIQGLGAGNKFLQLAEQRARQNHQSRIYLGVMVKNVKSLNWYIRHGFEFNEEMPFQMGKTSTPHIIGFKLITPA